MDYKAQLGIKVLHVPEGRDYQLFLGEQKIGEGRMIQYPEEVELAYLRIDEEHQGKGYGRVLVEFMVFNHPAQRITLTTIDPRLYTKMGFKKLTKYPNYVDHNCADCQACEPAKCVAMVFEKPEFLTKFEAGHPWFEDYRQLLKAENFMGSEFSLNVEALWSYVENIYVLKIQGFLFFVVYSFAVGAYGVVFPYRNIPESILLEFLDKIRSIGIKELHYLTSRASLQVLKLRKKHKMKLIEDRDSFDYLYKVSDFANYPGGAFEKKRNRVKKFIKNYPNAVLREYVSEDNARIFDFGRQIMLYELKISPVSVEVLQRGLDQNIFQGLVLENAGELCGFLLYSQLNPKTVVVHFECVSEKYDGAHAYINQQLGKKLIGKNLFINREQDLGLEGLRKSKMSYRPYRLIKKYSIIF